MARFDTQIVTAKRLIDKNGETSTFRRTTLTASGDPWDVDTPTVTNTPVSAVWLDFDEQRIDGELIRIGDQEVLIPASDLPSINPNSNTDVLIRENGEQWAIVRTQTLAPNEQVILHQVQVRR